jgi:glutamate dehydrogenase (NADP+)
LGGKVLTLSDSSGYIYDEEGIDKDRLSFVMRLKNLRRGRISEYIDKYSEAVYTEAGSTLDYNPLWNHKADCAFPSATQNEINGKDAQNLVNNGVQLVAEGANMPSTPEAINIYLDNKLLYAPGKAANAGGVAVSGLEMAQNSMRLNWPREEVDDRLKIIMKSIHQSCIDAAADYGQQGNYVAGANIAGFVKVVNAMLDQGLV